jgi:hypothetical protein
MSQKKGKMYPKKERKGKRRADERDIDRKAKK